MWNLNNALNCPYFLFVVAVFEKGQSETNQYRFMAQGGGYIWVCTQATLLFCEKKNIPLSVVCVNYVVR